MAARGLAAISALAAISCLCAISNAQLMHGSGGSMAMPAGVAPSANMTDPCYTDPTKDSCKTFRRMHMDFMTDLNSLCIAMPYMTACTLWAECKPLISQINPATNMSQAMGTYCSLVSLVADVCVEMPRMKGCEAYNALCAPGSAVEQCAQPGPLPAMVPDAGAGPNATTPLWTFDVKETVDAVCAATPDMEACKSCTSPGRMVFAECPDPLNTLSQICTGKPELEECSPFLAMCDDPAVQEMWPLICSGNFTVPEFKPVFASVNMTDPCYMDPTKETCQTFRRMHMDWTSDLTSLCNAMPFMVGCTLWEECKPLLSEINPATNMSMAFGTFCGMPSLVGAVCVEMPKMKGCEAYNALCAMGSVVAACTNPGVVPGVMWTYETKDQVDELCASPDANADACATCDSEGHVFNEACPDPTSTLVALCDAPEPPAQCASLTAMCTTNANASAVFTTTCAAYASNAPDGTDTTSMASHGAAVSLAALLLAVFVQAVLA